MARFARDGLQESRDAFEDVRGDGEVAGCVPPDEEFVGERGAADAAGVDGVG